MIELMRAVDKLSEIQEIELNLERSQLTTQDAKDICQVLSDRQLFRFSLNLAENNEVQAGDIDSVFKFIAA